MIDSSKNPPASPPSADKNPSRIEESFTLFKLITGELVVGAVVSDSTESVIVQWPQKIHISYEKIHGGFKQMSYMTDWLEVSESRMYLLQKANIVAAGLPDLQTRKEYLEILNAKIAALKSPQDPFVGHVKVTHTPPPAPPSGIKKSPPPATKDLNWDQIMKLPGGPEEDSSSGEGKKKTRFNLSSDDLGAGAN